MPEISIAHPHSQVIEPYASRFPFETWIAPFTHNASFGKTTNQELRELARVLGVTLRRLHRALDDPHFNLVIHTAPLEDELQAYFFGTSKSPRA
jgi:UDPglucose--hexose-1-phosphate uridylyltransferase